MNKIVILFFGTATGLRRFEDDYNIMVNVEYKLCVKFSDCRGKNFDAYMIHWSASEELIKEIQENKKLLQHLIEHKL